MLYAAGTKAWGVDYLPSKRVYCRHGERRAQLELGRDGDVDPLAHLAWSRATDVQHALASCVGSTHQLQARSQQLEKFVWRLELESKGGDGVTRVADIGQLSEAFNRELGALWSRVDTDERLRPHHLVHNIFLVGVTTACLSETQREAVKAPYSRSGFALAPVVKGFPMISFDFRKYGRKPE
jgi:hypothetical protein